MWGWRRNEGGKLCASVLHVIHSPYSYLLRNIFSIYFRHPCHPHIHIHSPSSSSAGPVWSSCLVTCTSTLYTDSSGPCFHYPPLNILNPNSVLRPTIIVPAWPFKDRSPCRCPRLLLLPLFLLMADWLLPHHCCLCELSAIRILRNLGNCGAIHVVPGLLDGWLAGLPNPKE